MTSRERNPQFCGAPDEFRSRSFYQLGPEGQSIDENLSSITLAAKLSYSWAKVEEMCIV